jgi:hypothetical protein
MSDTADDTTVRADEDGVVESIRELRDDAENDTSAATLVKVPNTQTALGTPTEKAAEQKAQDKRRLALKKEGFSDEDIDRILPIALTQKGSQRYLPMGQFTCSAAMVRYFEGRTEEQIIGDALKAVRRDGGMKGPVQRYVQIISAHRDDPTAAAKEIDEHTDRRITAIRRMLIATQNELIRRRVVAAGGDPTIGDHYFAIAIPVNGTAS